MSSPQHGSRGHSRLAPSKSATWTHCTASIQLIAENEHRLVPQSSVYATEGTQAHEIADMLMRGQDIPKNTDPDMVKHGQAYREYCASLHHHNKVVPTFVELAVPIFYLPEDKCHVDYMVFNHITKTVHIVDYKYGAGVPVQAEGNKQLSIYARSAIEHFDFDGWLRDRDTRIALHIFQPRLQDAPPYSTWETTWGEFHSWTEQHIVSAVKAIQTGKTEFAPSESACRWCPASSFCRARVALIFDEVPQVIPASKPEPFSTPAPEDLTDDQIARVVENAPFVSQWIKSVENFALGRALAGTPIPGTKLIAGRGTRLWQDPTAAVETLKALDVNPFSQSLMSPYQIEQLFKSMGQKLPKEVADLITKGEGKPKLVSESHPKPALEITTALSEFSPLSLDEDNES